MVLGGYALSRAAPALFHGPVETYATVSGIVTLYGVIFAVVEVWRLESATTMAAKAARDAVDQIERLHGAHALVECQASIDGALADIDAEDFVSSSALGRVIKLYSAAFATEVATSGSRQREDTLIIESYAGAFRRGNKTSTAKLRSALLRMTQDTSVAVQRNVVPEKRL